MAKEADEGDGKNVSMRNGAPGVLLDEDEVLGHEGPAYGHDHPAPVPELAQKGRGNVAPRAGHDDGVERRLLLPAVITVPLADDKLRKPRSVSVRRLPEARESRISTE